MKIAITASDKNIESLMDERFGRCAYFCVYNTETGKTVFIENELNNAAGGVGPQAARLLAENRINEVIAYEVGPKAKSILDRLNIKVTIVDKIMPLVQILNKLNN